MKEPQRSDTFTYLGEFMMERKRHVEWHEKWDVKWHKRVVPKGKEAN